MPQMIRVSAFALLLAACHPLQPTIPHTMAPSCGAAELQGLVGKPLSQFVAPPSAKYVRVIRPNGAVTLEYRPDRLNVEVDAARIIKRVYCT